MQLPFHSYQLDSRQANNARLLNCYAEQLPAGGKGPLVLRTAPGVVGIESVGPGPGRGLIEWRDAVYKVSGTKLYRVTSNGAVELGTIPGTGRVFMAGNSTQLVINAPGIGGYVYADGVVTQITDSDFLAWRAGPCDFADNFILFVNEGTGQFFGSELADAANYDALNFATAEESPDELVTLKASQSEVILLGKTSGERWYNAGTSGFPFARIPGGTFELGCAAKRSAFKLDNTVGWLASDLTVRMLRGATPQRVSQHGVETAIRSYARVDDCEAFTYTLNGHLCAVLRFPSAGACWVYDATTQEWHERQTYGHAGFDIADCAMLGGVPYVQSATTGAVGRLTSDAYTEFGAILRGEATFQGVQTPGNDPVFHQRLELLCEVGVGLLTGQGRDPRVTLEMSNDGGLTWHALPTRSLGAIGRYRQRVQWHALGASRHRVYRLSWSDPVPFTVWGAALEVEA